LFKKLGLVPCFSSVDSFFSFTLGTEEYENEGGNMKAWGKIVGSVYVAGLVVTAVNAMEQSFENLTLQSLGSLYLSLKKDMTKAEHRHQRSRRAVKKIKEKQGDLSRLLEKMQRDQTQLEREIHQLKADSVRRDRLLRGVGENLEREIENMDGHVEELTLATTSVKSTSVSSYSPIGNSPLIDIRLTGQAEGGAFIPEREEDEEGEKGT
jgi:hypothetical protein